MTSDTHQALADLLSVVTAIGGYLTPEQQDAVRRARAIVAAGGGPSAETRAESKPEAETATLERYRQALQSIVDHDVETILAAWDGARETAYCVLSVSNALAPGSRSDWRWADRGDK